LKEIKLSMVAHPCHPSHGRKYKIGGVVQASLGKKPDPISKITRTKRARSVTQAVKHLSSKCKALSSNHSTAKKDDRYFKYVFKK
jgi:hypothetical protein